MSTGLAVSCSFHLHGPGRARRGMAGVAGFLPPYCVSSAVGSWAQALSSGSKQEQAGKAQPRHKGRIRASGTFRAEPPASSAREAVPTSQLVKRSALLVPSEVSGSWLLLAAFWELHVESGVPLLL